MEVHNSPQSPVAMRCSIRVALIGYPGIPDILRGSRIFVLSIRMGGGRRRPPPICGRLAAHVDMRRWSAPMVRRPQVLVSLCAWLSAATAAFGVPIASAVFHKRPIAGLQHVPKPPMPRVSNAATAASLSDHVSDRPPTLVAQAGTVRLSHSNEPDRRHEGSARSTCATIHGQRQMGQTNRNRFGRALLQDARSLGGNEPQVSPTKTPTSGQPPMRHKMQESHLRTSAASQPCFCGWRGVGTTRPSVFTREPAPTPLRPGCMSWTCRSTILTSSRD